MTMKLTRDEESLIVFLETQLVDHHGKVLGASMNADDFAIAKRWNENGLISFKRVPMKEIQNGRTHQVQFSPKAWPIAHRLRRERAERHCPTLGEPSEPVKRPDP